LLAVDLGDAVEPVVAVAVDLVVLVALDIGAGAEPAVPAVAGDLGAVDKHLCAADAVYPDGLVVDHLGAGHHHHRHGFPGGGADPDPLAVGRGDDTQGRGDRTGRGISHHGDTVIEIAGKHRIGDQCGHRSRAGRVDVETFAGVVGGRD